MKRRLIILCITIATAITVCACATPKIEMKSLWKDPQYQGRQLSSVLVMGVADNQKVRTYFENEFVKQLKAHSTDAIASNTIFPYETLNDQAAVEEKIAAMGISSVLVVQVAYKSDVADALPQRTTWNEFYSSSFGGKSVIPAPSSDDPKRMAHMVMRLYDVKTENPFWTAESDVTYSGDPYNEVQAFIRSLIVKLAEDKLIK
jgi:hypothetical protein